MTPTHDNTGRGRPADRFHAPLCVIIIMQPINQHAPERTRTRANGLQRVNLINNTRGPLHA